MTFDKKDDYKESVKPVVDQLKKLCIQKNIPFFFCACVKNTEDNSEYEKELFSGLANGLNLNKDFFPDFIKVTAGFKTKMPIEETEFFFDE